MKILILGASGMLGYSVFSHLVECSDLNVLGTVRNISGKEKFFKNKEDNLIKNINVYDISTLKNIICDIKPNIIINCIGIIKQQNLSKQYIDSIKINALFPHELASICQLTGSKLIHFSTDCVFSGNIGSYTEKSIPDATDLYGRSKFLGEVNYDNHLTLRTSIIGHELVSNLSLVDWFLSQKESVNGYTNAIFSGLPTCYIAKLLIEKIIPADNLSGLYHLSVDPIDKFKLLSLISQTYNKKIKICESKDLTIDRSLISKKFRIKTDFTPPSWEDLIGYMYADYIKRYK
ncbi:dTDP-4-dehydrorhamnose reductase family protein [Providencia rustigianii]|uniref:dTDP-4-dehydrorhamnose reductase family protein n=1 Tax=Providencia rustigianii TaxID=158850 RepID=UPI000D94CAA1|nr:SDR family oxidoreductase [Providencia rustigianii]SPY79332.1 dTDP-4-dehydrorhamnose reductase [Providencia rustigianii]